MQLETAKLPGSRMDLKFNLDASDVEKAYNKVFSELADQGNVPGFRPGKAPAALLRRRFKPEDLRDMAWMRVMEDFVEPELEKAEFDIVGDPDFPDFREIPLDEGQGVEFTITVNVRPEPTDIEYTGLKLQRIIPEVTDEDVEKYIEDMRMQEATVEDVKDRETVESGDLVEAEVKVVLSGETDPMHTTTQEFEIGSGRYTPAIDEQMVGHKVGDSVFMAVDYPEDAPSEELAGKSGEMTAELKSIRTRVLPELNDEFAKKVGAYEDLEDLKAQVRADLLRKRESESKEALENDAISAIVKSTDFDIPEVMVDGVNRRQFQEMAQDLERDGISMQQFAEISGVDEETMLARNRSRAESSLRTNLVLEAIRKQEAVDPGEEDLMEELRLFGSENNLEEDFLVNALEVQEGFREQLLSRAELRLTLQRIIDQAEIEDISRERYLEIKKAEQEAARAEAETATEDASEEPQAAETTDDQPAEEATPETEEAPAAEAADVDEDVTEKSEL